MNESLNYEIIEKQNSIEELFYAIICRRWDVLSELVVGKTWCEIKDAKFKDTSVTVEQCISKNMQFIKSNKNKKDYKKIADRLGTEFCNIVSDKNTNYDTNDFYIDANDKKHSVLDVFFDGNQPILNVKHFEKQELASKQVMKNKATMVLDEVGTGKTVSALYAIQKVVQHNKDTNFGDTKILVICPYNKREDWNSDIYRQLGRESVIVSQKDKGSIIKNKPRSKNKPLIFITGCKGGKGDDSNNALKVSLKKYNDNEKWDLVIIDECHDCFDNYDGIKAERVMLLTATPIAPKSNTKDSLDFDSYKKLLESILGKSNCYQTTTISNKYITPITTPNPTEDDIFVCHFKEDIFDVYINRKITFVSCRRHVKRQEWFNELRYATEWGFFPAIFADQDDFLLSKKMKETFKNSLTNYTINDNPKLDKLVEIVEGINEYNNYKTKSLIIFCEHVDVVDMIFNKLSSLGLQDTLVGKKHGKACEIKNFSQNPDIVIDKLKSFIKEKTTNRAILITTGKSGGTGLNMGEFDTVIHYELPFTSNELEQRFGRIERADDLINLNQQNNNKPIFIENEMIFLINENISGESDFITNRMLYYSISKINKTCMYMPIRNTVLFHGDWISRIKEEAKKFFETLEKDMDNTVVEEFISYKEQQKEVKTIMSKIVEKLPGKDKEKLNGLSIEAKIKELFDNISLQNTNELIEKDKEALREYHNKDKSKNIKFEENLDKILEYYIWLINTFKLLGYEPNNESEKLEELFTINNYKENISENDREELNQEELGPMNMKEEEEKIESSVRGIKNKIIQKNKTITDLCKNILAYTSKINSNQKSSGIYYVRDNRFINESVEDFRKNSAK